MRRIPLILGLVLITGSTKSRRRILQIGIVLLLVGAGISCLLMRARDPMFRGKPESHWIEQLSYRDDEQVRQWREFGPEGVRVLVRALNRANRPGPRLYRKTYRNLGRVLPGSLLHLLPAPPMDSTRATRMKIADLLSRLSNEARLATPAMIRALRDEDSSVRQIALTFFTSTEDERCLLNQMDPSAKRALLPEFLRAIRDSDEGVRNNAAVALRYYPDQAQLVVPALLPALQDPKPEVRRLAAVALKQIDPAAAAKAGVK